jgi:DNA-binding response OmpR family regulator
MSAAYHQPVHRILVVDDDIDLLMLLERRLVKEHYVVETAASLPEAEEIMARFAPQLVLLDINIKGSDGRQLCWKLKHTPNPIIPKVLLMSGYDCSLSRAVLFGADGVIAKPIATEYLLHQITQQLHDSANAATAPMPIVFKDNLG